MKKKKEKGKRILNNVILFIAIPLVLLIVFDWLIALIIFAVFALNKTVQIIKRGYFILDRDGKEVKFKEFFKRWKSGVEGITPLQQAKTNLMGNWIVLSGIIGGMIINALVRVENQWWWIEVILGGSLILVVIQMIGGFQKYWRFKELDKQIKELE